MGHFSQSFKNTKKTLEDSILALSWNIATEPKLYRELSSNPYSSKALQIISERFPNVNINDAIRAVVLAEPEGKYDRNFEYLGKIQQEKELYRQKVLSAQINRRLDDYRKKHAKELSLLSKESVYDSLSIVAFGTDDLKGIEQKYAQSQRRGFRLLIVNFIEGTDAIKTTDAKPNQKVQVSRMIFASFSIIFLILLAYGLYAKQVDQRTEANKQVLASQAQKEIQPMPKRLKIPSINIDASIEYVGLTSDGAMEVPSNTLDVGWFDRGPRPGEKGSAVIAGHLDGKNDKEGVFTNLHKLKEGDKIYVEGDKGASIVFVVQEKLIYDPAYSDGVFSRNDKSYLNLITCDGVWDGVKKSYSKRLVIFATAETAL